MPSVLVLWEEPTRDAGDMKRWVDEQVARLREHADVERVDLLRFTAVAEGWPRYHTALLELWQRHPGTPWETGLGPLLDDIAGDLRLLGTNPVILVRSERDE